MAESGEELAEIMKKSEVKISGDRLLSSAVARALPKSANVVSLDLSQNLLPGNALESISSAMLKNGSLKTLRLSSCGIGTEGVYSLADALKTDSALEVLDLHSNDLGVGGSGYLSKALQVNSGLKHLDVSNNNFGPRGAKAISSALEKNDSLTELDLALNDIRARGTRAVAAALRVNTALKELNLSANGFGDAGASDVAGMLNVNTQLRALLNKIGPDGARALAGSLEKNSKLLELSLCQNRIAESGAEAFAAALQANYSLTWLSVADNSISIAGAEKLQASLKTNSNLQRFSYYGVIQTQEETNGESTDQRRSVRWRIPYWSRTPKVEEAVDHPNFTSEDIQESFAESLKINRTEASEKRDGMVRRDHFLKVKGMQVSKSSSFRRKWGFHTRNPTTVTPKPEKAKDSNQAEEAPKGLNGEAKPVEESKVLEKTKEASTGESRLVVTATESELENLLNQNGFARLVPDFHKENVRTIDDAAKLSREELRLIGKTTLAERKRLVELFAPVWKKTPMGRLLEKNGLGQYAQSMYMEGVHTLQPLTREDLKEVGVEDQVHRDYLVGLLEDMVPEPTSLQQKGGVNRPFGQLAALLFGPWSGEVGEQRCHDCKAKIEEQDLAPVQQMQT